MVDLGDFKRQNLLEDNMFFFLDVRLGQFYLLEVLLRLLITHANMAAQRQESPVGTQ